MNEFKLIVAGGRDFDNYAQLSEELTHLANGIYASHAVSIVSGLARGADSIGRRFALSNDVKCYDFPAEWNKYGNSAGFIRNEQMGNFSDGLLAFWDGKSAGTKNMIHYMRRLGKPVHVVMYGAD